MLIVNRVGEQAAAYYRSDLGQWWGGGIAAIGVEGAVRPEALRAVLRGAGPLTGLPLQARHVPNRRAGWDLIFAGPKSVSLLASMGAEPAATILTDAHRRAVDDTLRWFEVHGCWARRHGSLVSTEGIVAARYDHTSSSAGDPHLHTHVLVANLVRSGGQWSALDSSGIWLQQRALAATYHLGLRHHIREGGLSFDWRLEPDGSFDIAGVPRRAVDAASSRRMAIQAMVGPGEHPGSAGESARRLVRLDAVGPWAKRVAATGFSTDDANRLIDQGFATAWSERAAAARPSVALPPAGPAAGDRSPTPARDDTLRDNRTAPGERALVAAVVTHLTDRRSTFNVPDVMAALAASHGPGATATEVSRWSESLCTSSLTTADGRWTTPYARAIDDRLRRLGAARDGRSTTALSEATVDRLMAARPDLDPALADGVRGLTTSRDGIIVVGSPLQAPGQPRADAWVAQAAVLEAAGQVWKAAGIAVEVHAGSDLARQRWRALTGLDTRSATHDRLGAGVLIVDRADRATTAALSELLATAPRHTVTVVLVEGGTLPARRRALSEGLEGIAADHRQVMAIGRPSVVDRMTETWAEVGPPGQRPLLVGLGPGECHVLNQRARDRLRTEGAIGPDEATIGPRSYAVGDRVMALRRQAGPAGRIGQVEAVDARHATMDVTWSDGLRQRVDRRLGPYVAHAYATTPAMLRLIDGPVVVLGERRDLGRHADRALTTVTTEREKETISRPSPSIDLGL